MTATASSARKIRLRMPSGGPRSGVGLRLGGIVLLGALTLYFRADASSFHLFIFNSALLAIIGASALNLLMGTVGQVSIGNAAFLAVGAMSSVISLRAGAPFPLDLVVAVAVAAVMGFLVGLPALRIRGVYLAFATLAAHFILIQVAQSYQSHVVGPSGFMVNRLFQGSLIDQQRSWSIVLVVVVVVVLALIYFLTTGRVGRAWRLIRDNEIVAPSLGIPVTRYKLAAFTLSSALIALQGGLAAHFAGYVSAESFSLALAIAYVAMVLIGGADSQLGSVVGAAIVIWLPYLTTDVLGWIGPASNHAPQISQIIYGALIVFFVTYSRGGLADWLKRAGGWVWARISGRPTPPKPLADDPSLALDESDDLDQRSTRSLEVGATDA